MHIELRTPGLALPRARLQNLRRELQAAFARLADRIARIVLAVGTGEGATGQRTRRCSVEVHMNDGCVERVEVRRRHVGALLQGAIARAWRAAARRLEQPQAPRPAPRLQAPRAPAGLLPAPAGASRRGRT